MEYAAESRDTELVEELASWFLKKVFLDCDNHSVIDPTYDSIALNKRFYIPKLRDVTIAMPPVFTLVTI